MFPAKDQNTTVKRLNQNNPQICGKHGIQEPKMHLWRMQGGQETMPVEGIDFSKCSRRKWFWAAQS